MRKLYWWGQLVGTVDDEGCAQIDRSKYPQAWCAAQYERAPGFEIRDSADKVNGQSVCLVKSDGETMREVL